MPVRWPQVAVRQFDGMGRQCEHSMSSIFVLGSFCETRSTAGYIYIGRTQERPVPRLFLRNKSTWGTRCERARTWRETRAQKGRGFLMLLGGGLCGRPGRGVSRPCAAILAQRRCRSGCGLGSGPGGSR